MSDTPLFAWTVYENPKDYPGKFVARKFEIWNEPLPTDEIIVSDTLEQIRGVLAMKGLIVIPRDPGDAPEIAETWL